MSLAEKVENPATVELLEVIGDAFNARDVDRIMSFFAEDAVFDNARGAEVHGQRFKGHAAIRATFEGVIARSPDIQWHGIDHRIADDKGYSEWRRQATGPDGRMEDCLGLDIFTFRDSLIARKDTYMKLVS